jgi:membrane protease YdiL (CAAX protease family)
MSAKLSQRVRAFVRTHQVSTYIVLAYTVSWSIWPLVRLNPDSSPMVPFGPALAAIVVVIVSGGFRALTDLLRGLTHVRVAPRWYLAAVALPAGIVGAAFLTALAQGAPAPEWDLSSAVQLATTVATTVVVVGLFEELGWRGYLLPLLQRRRRALDAALLVGLAWLPWHLPELISDPSQRPPLQFALIVMAQSVLLAWLYNNTSGSLPVVMLFHAAFNSVAQFLLAGVEGSLYQTAWWVMAVLTFVAAVLAVWRAGSRSLIHGDVRTPDERRKAPTITAPSP